MKPNKQNNVSVFQVGPTSLTTIKKFIAHIDTSVVPIKFEHIRIPNSFGGGGGGGGGGE